MASEQQTTLQTELEVFALWRSIAGFTRDLYDQISKNNPDDNLFFSPYSIAVALGMTYVGARGNTASQMAKAMKLKPGDSSVHHRFRKLIAALKTGNAQYTLITTNNIFPDQKFKVLEEFLEVVKNDFGADVTNVNYVSDSEGSRSTINQWVAKETNDKIKDLIPPGMLSEQTVMVLVNAIYFKGNWERPFVAEVTTPKPFYLSNGKTFQADMMYQKATFPIGWRKELDCQILELPYVQNDLSMFIFLPRQASGLTRLEESLTPSVLQWAGRFVSPQTVEVSLPRFKLEIGQDLSGILGQLGIKDLFSAGVSDLSGVDGRKGLFVSNVVHKAFVEVNEQGTEAAAVTKVSRSYCSMDEQQFNANHPFLFCILHNKTGAILFIGRLLKPEVSGKMDCDTSVLPTKVA